MLPQRLSTGFVKVLLILWVVAGMLSPFAAEAAHKHRRSAHKVAHKVSKVHKTQKKAVVGKRSKHVKRHPPPVDRQSANYADLIMEARTGRILHATDPDELRHPASLTKMMTLYLAFQALKTGQLHLNQMLPVSQNAASQEPSKLGLRPGQQIRVEDALLGLVTKSANDATVVVAEALGGSEEQFARLMTNKARALGMKSTVFRNPSGLPNPEQVTTARDMAILGYALIYHHPQFYPYFSRVGFTYAGIRHNNHNHLMKRYQGMDGIKTGYIRASGFNLVASTVREQTRLIGVVFGGRSAVSRDNKMASLLDQAFAKVHQERLNRVAESENDGVNYVMVPSSIPAFSPEQPVTVASSRSNNL
ncbi:D-alanyl-D-alanine carboxypeptidase family protein [Candidatus Magnetaquicoccus inordinatus]|uniref:D-alanyl-D-alanine carboxypeptidase family protein n=1 Tax=Candidatus Magnetaquicoccus inordinatus TaxID=2496818 RepID=UPI001D0E5CF4|nr:D-alanyl-D-alanine carboxypeptidase family protein [Candidatus Magnetaquicoccus inordinatus]